MLPPINEKDLPKIKKNVAPSLLLTRRKGGVETRGRGGGGGKGKSLLLLAEGKKKRRSSPSPIWDRGLILNGKKKKWL